MQDIDFEALDQEVHKIMNQKKQVAEKKARLRQQQSRGRNMDIINVAHSTTKPISKSRKLTPATLARPTTSAQVAPRTVSQTVSSSGTASQAVSSSGTASQTKRSNRGLPVDGIRRVKPATATTPRTSNMPTASRTSTMASRPRTSTTPAPRTSTAPQSSRTVIQQPAPAQPVKTLQATSRPADLSNIASVSRGANLLRQRRRLNQVSEAMTAPAIAPMIESANRSTDSLVTGHYQSETLSTKQPDGSETVYQYDSVDYVAKLAPKTPQQPASTPISASQPSNRIHQPQSSVVDLDEMAELEAIKPTETDSTSVRRVDLPPQDRSSSPFLDSAKVDKRPLGVPYDKATTNNRQASTLQVEPTTILDDTATLYRGDLSTTPDAPSKWSTAIWILLTIVAIIGASVGIYLLTVYNK